MFIHNTKDGTQVDMFSMKEDHLQNTIKLIVNKISKTKKDIDNIENFKKNSFLYNRIPDVDELTNIIRNSIGGLSVYLMVAKLRKLEVEHHFEALQDVFSEDIKQAETFSNYSNSFDIESLSYYEDENMGYHWED